MTLDQLVALRSTEADPAPIAVTPKGDAVRLLYRLVHALGVLPEDDRAELKRLLAEEIESA